MKNKILISLLFFTVASFGQRIKLAYDEAGNQIQRTVCLCSARMAPDAIYKTPETITEDDMIADAEYEQISYYPNPVREELYVKWKNQDGMIVSGIELISMTGQLLRSYPNLKNTNNASIVFRDFPEDVYNLVLVYENGERKTLKIVKN